MNKEDLLYKNYKSREFTSDDKKWYEEKTSDPQHIHFGNVLLDEIPESPPAITTDVVEIISDLTLTKDFTTDDNKAWYACSTQGILSTRLYDFIQPDKNKSNKYNIKIFDNTGIQLLVDDILWDFDYQNGILTFETDPTLEYEAPFHLYGYRYIGEKASKESLGAQTLDEAYNGGSEINTDNGPVIITPSAGSSALKITSVDYVPTEDLTGDELINYKGILYIYDTFRSTWISLDRQTVSFGVKRADGIFLNLSNFSSNMSGWPAIRDGMILGITAQAAGGYPNKRIKLFKKDTPGPLFEFDLDDLFYANGDIGIPFEKNDLIKIFVSSEFSTVYNLIVNIEIGWRAS